MKCLRCGFRNAATVGYCQKCGAKIDLTVDEIQDALVDKARGEQAASTAHYAQQSLFFAVVIFMFVLTVFVLTGGTRSDVSALPSIVGGTRHVEVDYRIGDRLELPKGLVPFAAKRR